MRTFGSPQHPEWPAIEPIAVLDAFRLSLQPLLRRRRNGLTGAKSGAESRQIATHVQTSTTDKILFMTLVHGERRDAVPILSL